MLETFAALFLAHVVADYVVQTRRMVETKHQTATMALHVGLVLAVAAVAVGFVGWAALAALTLAHGAMDLIKTHVLPARRLWPYMLDQTVHIATILVVAALAPGLPRLGLWGSLAPGAIEPMTIAFLIAGFAVFAVRAGGFAIELGWTARPPAGAGARLWRPSCWFGQAERGLVFGLVVIGQPVWIALLLLAKPVLRYDQIRSDRAVTQYLLGTTVLSFGWAICTAAVLLLVLPNGALETFGLNP